MGVERGDWSFTVGNVQSCSASSISNFTDRAELVVVITLMQIVEIPFGGTLMV
jgi:hypothetical protein